MNAIQRRMLIAQKSSTQKQVDPRPRCEDCGAVLTRIDYDAYHDGCPTIFMLRLGEPLHPRCCEECADQP